jgi:hypothetical protein
MECEDTFCLNDLDIALELMTKVSEMYLRLSNKQMSSLLQILAKKSMEDTSDEIIDYE